MKISGFTIIKNAVLYDFPIVESIESLLPLVDELIVVAGDSSDATDELLRSITSPKVQVIHSVWSTDKYKDKGQLFAYQTDLALKGCSGDWCIYLQSDEVLHEDSVEVIRKACQYYLPDQRVEGMTLNYVHIYADYKRYIDAKYFAYPCEVRVVRRREDIHSWRDAQSFRVMPHFDYRDYWQKEGTRALDCVQLDALVFHYGWSRNPYKMLGKMNFQRKVHYPEAQPIEGVDYYDYGNLSFFPLYKGTQPKAMSQRIQSMDWGGVLRYRGAPAAMNKKFSVKYRVVNFIERLMGGTRRIGGFKNYRIVERFKANKKI